MKTIKTLMCFAITCCMFFTSCLPDVELGPEPVRGSIIRFKLVNFENAEIKMNDRDIVVTLPLGSSVTGLVPDIIVSLGAKILDFTAGNAMDFSKEVTIKVQGTDGIVVEYKVNVFVKEPQPGFTTPELLWEKRHEDLGWANNSVYSAAVSKDYVVVSQNQKIETFNALTGDKVGLMTMPGGTIHQIANDDKGVIIAITVASTNADIVLYKWENVNSVPVELSRWKNDIVRTDGASNTNTNIGRGQLSIRGDLSGDAVIYIPATLSPYVLRWTIKNGVIKSQVPEKILYAFDNGATNFPNPASAVSALGPNPEDGYTVSSTQDYTYNTPAKRYIFNTTDGPKPYRGYVFNFNKATYFAGFHYRSTGGYFYVYDITKPAGIEMNETQRFEKGIDFKPFTSTTFTHVPGANNASLHGGFAIKYLNDGTAILYYLYSNSGLRAYKLTPKP